MLLTSNFKTIEITLLICCIFLILVIFFIVKAIKKHFNYKKQLLETQKQILQEFKKNKG